MVSSIDFTNFNTGKFINAKYDFKSLRHLKHVVKGFSNFHF